MRKYIFLIFLLCLYIIKIYKNTRKKRKRVVFNKKVSYSDGTVSYLL